MKFCIGTLLGVAVYTNQLAAVNMETSALYYIISQNYVPLFPRLQAKITNSLQTPSLGFTLMVCQHFWAKYASGTVLLYQKTKFLQHSLLSPPCEHIYGVKPTGILPKY